MPQADQNYCAYVLKFLSAGFAILGVIFSWRAARTCEFISFVDNDGNPPDLAEDPPFNTAISANVGIFRYEVTRYVNGAGSGDCVAYDDRWGSQQAYPSLATAQFCSIIAPIFAVLGAFAAMMDLCVCSFAGSFVTASLLLLVASGVQAGTFTVVADPVFCFEDADIECEPEKGVYLSSAAVIFFFVASCLMCCAPSADPFCFNFGRKHEHATKKVEEPGNRTIVLQPIVIHENNNNEKSNKKSKKKKVKNSKKMSNKV